MSGLRTSQELSAWPSRVEFYFLFRQMAKEHQQLIEIVANFPKELVITCRYARVSYLICRVQRQFLRQLYHRSGVHISHR